MQNAHFILYGIPNCSTVKKARDWLDSRGVVYTFHDFKKLGISADKIANWQSQTAWQNLINRSGLTWRNLTDAEKQTIVDAKSASLLMQQKTSLIKRPVLEIGHLQDNPRIICFGFDEKTYQKAFPHE